MSQAEIDWPSFDEGYTDEFGEMEASVYAAAKKIWPSCRRYAREKLGDEATGQHLLFKAASQVSRRMCDSAEQIQDLQAYLWSCFIRLVLNERQKNQRQHSADEVLEHLPVATDLTNLENNILLYQILSRMNAQTRQLFRLRTLGYSYEEIGQMIGKQPNVLRSQLSKEINKIKQELST